MPSRSIASTPRTRASTTSSPKPGPNGDLIQRRTFYRYHKDWRNRADAPYILFEPQRTAFNLETPFHVSRYEPDRGHPDVWGTKSQIKELEQLLFSDTRRRLTTSDKHSNIDTALCTRDSVEHAELARDDLLSITLYSQQAG